MPFFNKAQFTLATSGLIALVACKNFATVSTLQHRDTGITPPATPQGPVLPPVASGIPAWVDGRNTDNHIVLDSKSKFGLVTFGWERSFEDIKTGFAVGHGIPDIENKLFYNLRLDGYGGLPYGSCLKRASFMADSDPTKAICAANENQDLLRDWSQWYSRPDDVGTSVYKNVLIKNVEVKNAFRTFNAIDGVIVKTFYDLPHTDTFQAYYGGGAEKNSQWMVIQDSSFKNSDNSLMIIGNVFYRGFVYQNLKVSCDAEFGNDAHTRVINDYALNNLGAAPESFYYCTNLMQTGSINPATAWLIEVDPADKTVTVQTNGAPVIIVGSNKDTLNIRFWPAGTSAPVCRYATIEDALSDTNASVDGCGNYERPPFIELSCAGWKNKPSECETRQGFLGVR